MWFLKTLVAWFWRKKLEKIGKVSERKVGIPKNKGVVFLSFRYTKISRKMWGIQLCCWF